VVGKKEIFEKIKIFHGVQFLQGDQYKAATGNFRKDLGETFRCYPGSFFYLKKK